jgi:peptide deformylase
MAIKKIRKIGDPVLRENSKPVQKIDRPVLELVRDMLDTLQDEGGVGLAAPQIGVTRRVIIVRFEDKAEAYVNPELEVVGNDLAEGDEGCLSIYSIQGFRVERSLRTKVKALNIKGEPVDFIAEDMLARILQHEVDHLNGILFIDHLDADSRMELLKKVEEFTSP